MYSEANDIMAFPELMRNIQVRDLNKYDIVKLLAVDIEENSRRNYSDYRDTIGNADDQVVDDISYSSVSRCVIRKYDNGDFDILNISFPGLRNIQYILSNGKLVSVNYETLRNDIIFQVIGARCTDVTFTRLKYSELREKKDYPSAVFFDPEYTANPAIRACLPAKVMIVSPLGQYKVVPLRNLIYEDPKAIPEGRGGDNSVPAKLYGNIYCMYKGKLLVRSYWHNTRVKSNKCLATDFAKNMSSLMLSGLNITKSGDLLSFPNERIVALSKAITHIDCKDSLANVEAIKFPERMENDIMLHAHDAHLKNIVLPKVYSTTVSVKAESIDAVTMPERFGRVFSLQTYDSCALQKLDLHNCADTLTKISLAGAHQLKTCIFAGSTDKMSTYWNITDQPVVTDIQKALALCFDSTVEFRASDLHDFSGFALARGSKIIKFELTLLQLAQSVVVIKLLEPVRTLDLTFSVVNPDTKILIQHNGVSVLNLYNMNTNKLSSSVTVNTISLTKNTINQKRVGSLINYVPIRKYKKEGWDE